MFYNKTSQTIKKVCSIFYYSLLLILLTLSLFTCSKKSTEYAVLLYSGMNNAIPAGTVFRVIGKASVHKDNLYEGSKTILKTSHENMIYNLPKQYLYIFQSLENTKIFAKRYEKYQETFGVSTVNGLHVRDRPETHSRTKHRLRKGEPVKVISRTEQMDEADGEKDYWYFIQTKEGIRGYCFGYYVEINEHDYWMEKKEKANEKEKEKERAKPLYPLLDNILSATWHPYFIYEQIKNGDLNADIVEKNYGLFFNKKNRTIKIKMPGIDFETHYYKIKKVDYNTYNFWDSGVVVTRIDDRNIKMSFNHNGNIIQQRFIKLSISIKEVVEEKEEQQQKRLNSLIKHSRFLVSDSYGEMTLNKDGTFLWETTPFLPSYIISIDSEKLKGTIDFTVELATKIKRNYKGAFKLQIANNNFTKEIFFLYKIMDKGLQVTYVPADAVTFNKITDTPLSPLIMFFQYKSGKKQDKDRDITKL